MKNFIIYSLVAGTIALYLINLQLQSADSEFQGYKLEFQKKYHSESDEQYRKLIFLKNKVRIELHNSDPEQTYKKGINQFTDMTLTELQHMYSDLTLSSSFMSTQ